MREGRLRTQALALALVDALMVVLAMQIAWWVRFDLNQWAFDHGYWHISVGWTPKYPYFLAVFVTLPLFWLIFREMGLYSEPENSSGEFFRVSAAALVSCVLLAALGFAIRTQQVNEQFQYSRAYSLVFFVAVIDCICMGRWLYRYALRSLTREGIGQNRILFVGDGPLAHELAKALDAMGSNRVVGTLTLASNVAAHSATEGERGHTAAKSSDFPLPVLGTSSQLSEFAAKHGVQEVVVVLPEASKATLRELAEDCYRAHVRFRMVPDVYDMLLDHMNLTLIADIPLLGMRGFRIEGVNFLFKRIFDLIVSSVLLILLVPTVFLPVAIAIKLNDRGPIFYFQERIGYRRKHFKFWKFRSMRVGADQAEDVAAHKDYLKRYIGGTAGGPVDSRGKAVFKITDDPRITRIGRFLRQFSIDELPQLWNVLRGDMSLIGPRPPVAYEVDNYRPIHLRRFEVLPGISGLWQVSGRNRLTFEEMVKLDLYYIENWSLELDVRILFKTISVVLFHRAY
jgi:exopolysaccharide biosynthesis polyprenyl glycosylphosphotransferase